MWSTDTSTRNRTIFPLDEVPLPVPPLPSTATSAPLLPCPGNQVHCNTPAESNSMAWGENRHWALGVVRGVEGGRPALFSLRIKSKWPEDPPDRIGTTPGACKDSERKRDGVSCLKTQECPRGPLRVLDSVSTSVLYATIAILVVTKILSSRFIQKPHPQYLMKPSHHPEEIDNSSPSTACTSTILGLFNQNPPFFMLFHLLTLPRPQLLDSTVHAVLPIKLVLSSGL